MIPKYIIIHDSDSSYANPFMIDSWHRDRGFSYSHENSDTNMSFGYHFMITNGRIWSSKDYNSEMDGLIIPGRPSNVEGAHCKAKRRNYDSLGILFSGPYFTPKQLGVGFSLCHKLKISYNIPTSNMLGHKEQDPLKSDPRFSMEWFRTELDKIGG